jgi:hypothetical protein
MLIHLVKPGKPSRFHEIVRRRGNTSTSPEPGLDKRHQVRHAQQLFPPMRAPVEQHG